MLLDYCLTADCHFVLLVISINLPDIPSVRYLVQRNDG